MTNKHADFLLYSGATWSFDASLHDATGAPLNLTGAEIAWRLYSAHGAPTLELTVNSGITVTDAAGGLCQILVPAAQTSPLAAGAYSDEVRVVLPSGFTTVQAVGSITVALAGAPAAPPDLATELAALKSARARGIRGTTIEGFSVTYASDAEMAAAIASLERELAAAQGVAPVRNVVLRSKGWS